MAWTRRRPASIPARVGFLTCALLGLSACSSVARPLLHSAGGNVSASREHVSAGFSLSTRRGQSYSELVAIDLCATSTPVHIESVTLHDPTQGFVLRDWGIDNAYSELGDTTGPLSTLGDYSSHRVTQHCSHGARWSQVGVELARTGADAVHAMGFDVHYRDGSAQRTLWLGYTVELTAARRTRRPGA